MPPLTPHFRFAALVMPRLGLPPNAGLFLLGSLAPDAFEPDSEEGFTQHHFIGQDGKISLATFTQATGFSWRSAHEPGWPLTCGYYAHLWLDVFYRNHGDDLPVRRPNGMSDVDLRLTLRKETEYINSPHFLGMA